MTGTVHDPVLQIGTPLAHAMRRARISTPLWKASGFFRSIKIAVGFQRAQGDITTIAGINHFVRIPVEKACRHRVGMTLARFTNAHSNCGRASILSSADCKTEMNKRNQKD